jgi:predicted nuclease of predicted toxin-antitoxin system
VLTCDLDFGNIMAVSGGISSSVIIFRLENEKPENVNQRLQQVL